MKHTCLVCSAPFENSHAAAKYCSKPCGWKAQRKHPDKPCERCGAVFVARWSKARYCSAPCRLVAQRETNRRPVLDRSGPEPDPVPGARWIGLGNGRWTQVDDADLDVASAYSWSAITVKGGNVYAVARVLGRLTYLHRYLLGEGCPRQVDHRDGDGLNNRRSNLRAATNSNNAANKRKSPGKTSRYKGVCWNAKRSRWVARICVDGRATNLGYFTDEAAAGSAYDEAAVERFGRFARVNFPEPGEQPALVDAPGRAA